MTDQTFKIRTGPQKTDVRDFPFEEPFSFAGEEWVVHRRFQGIGFTVSHRETGIRLPGIDRERAVEAKHLATLLLTEKQDQISNWVERAKS